MFAFFKDTKKLVLCAMLSALSFILALIEIPTPFLSYLSLDASEIPILVGANLLGPGGLLVITLLRSILRFALKGTLIFGEIAAILASLTLGFIFTFINKKMDQGDVKKNQKIALYTLIITIITCFTGIVLLIISAPVWQIGGIIVLILPLLFCLYAFIRKDKSTQIEFCQTIISVLVVTVFMVILNFFFITPSNALQKFAFYPELVNLWFDGSIRNYIYATIVPLIPFNILKFTLVIWLYIIIKKILHQQLSNKKTVD